MAALYRVGWFFLMVLVMAPAFIMAGSVDGITFREADWVVASAMHNQFSIPWDATVYWSAVIAFVAQLLPASSIVAVLGGEMIWEHLGVIFTFLFFAMVKPPFYAEVERKYGTLEQTA